MSHRFLGMLTLGAAAGGMLGCSDPVPPAAAAGLLINIGRCPATSPVATLGNPNPDSRRPASAGDPLGKPIYSGESGTSVSCSVAADGSVFGSVSRSGLSFSVRGNVNPADGVGTATVAMFAGGISQEVSQPASMTDAPCTITVIRTSNGFQMEPGAIWATFNCPSMKATLAECSGIGEFLFQRCKD